MSVSDAAPLPRLGEVFFDVRGNSRSMRLSWYADTGVAVFSIWQGGRCTGTFRLPMDDLPRMVEILQRGPQRRRSRPDGGYSADWEQSPVEAPAQQDYPTGSYWQPDEPGRPAEPASHRRDRGPSRERDYRQDREHEQEQGYGGEPDYGQGPNYGDERGYGQHRVVPPYMQAVGESNPDDNSVTGGGDRRGLTGPAYPADRPTGPSPARQQPEPPWSEGGYSGGPDYRLGTDQSAGVINAPGRHSSGA
jgi:hypothetical protein